MPKSVELQEIQAKIAKIVEDIIGREPLFSDHLVGQGLDSLAAMELRQKVQVNQILVFEQVMHTV